MSRRQKHSAIAVAREGLMYRKWTSGGGKQACMHGPGEYAVGWRVANLPVSQ